MIHGLRATDPRANAAPAFKGYLERLAVPAELRTKALTSSAVSGIGVDDVNYVLYDLTARKAVLSRLIASKQVDGGLTGIYKFNRKTRGSGNSFGKADNGTFTSSDDSNSQVSVNLVEMRRDIQVTVTAINRGGDKVDLYAEEILSQYGENLADEETSIIWGLYADTNGSLTNGTSTTTPRGMFEGLIQNTTDASAYFTPYNGTTFTLAMADNFLSVGVFDQVENREDANLPDPSLHWMCSTKMRAKWSSLVTSNLQTIKGGGVPDEAGVRLQTYLGYPILTSKFVGGGATHSGTPTTASAATGGNLGSNTYSVCVAGVSRLGEQVATKVGSITLSDASAVITVTLPATSSVDTGVFYWKVYLAAGSSTVASATNWALAGYVKAGGTSTTSLSITDSAVNAKTNDLPMSTGDELVGFLDVANTTKVEVPDLDGNGEVGPHLVPLAKSNMSRQAHVFNAGIGLEVLDAGAQGWLKAKNA